MLLYAKVAQPKAPKKRSRAGCTHCKEKKKKCDETRPQCQRCADKQLDCAYEPVKPRQRRRQVSKEPLTPLSPPARPPALDLSFQGYGSLGDWEAASPASSALAVRTPAAQVLEEGLLTPATGGIETRPAYEALEALETKNEEDEEDVTTAVTTVATTTAATTATANVMSLTHVTGSRTPTSPIILPGLSTEHPHFAPLYADFANLHRRRTLVDHFCNVLSRLIVLNEDSGNPFQRLVLPMCQRSEAVRNAVYALASAHREYRGLVTDGEGGENSAYFYNLAIQGITMLIEKGAKTCRNELLAAIMLLVYYEVLVKDGSTNIVDGHLKGAMSVISTINEGLDDTGVFLERAFRFYEVISALSFGTAPLTNPSAGNRVATPPAPKPASQLGDVDTLLGMASTLWPILHKLSTLLALKRELESTSAGDADAARTASQSEFKTSAYADTARIAALQSEFETSAYAVDVALKRWKPNLPPQLHVVSSEEAGAYAGEDIFDAEGKATASQRAHLQSVLNNALAYQHGAIVYLHRTIYGHSRRHALVQRHAHIALTHCVATVRNGGPMGALLWPLFVAACEAVTPGDRDLARQTFAVLGQRQGMLNIERAWFIIEEVWRRADTAEEFAKASQSGSGTLPIFKGRDLWRRVSEEMGVTIVFG